jgi:hypothetical protein
MKVNWSVLNQEHVQRACELVAASKKNARGQGIVVLHRGARLPAKEVARVAYLLATSQPLDTRLVFSSGDSTINRLRKLGCTVERVAPSEGSAKSGGSN